MIAIGKYLRIKHKKAQIIASMLRGKKAESALDLLRYVPKKASLLIYKVLKSAISNAENNFKKDREKLVVQEILVNKGPELKRIRPVSRGRAHRITKGVSHISVKLAEISIDPAIDRKETSNNDNNSKDNKK
jgi:large subunit ribosomal protein L22